MRHVSGLRLAFCGIAVALLYPISAAADGAATFKAKCVLCHGADGTGSTVLGKQLQAANLRSKEVQQKSDADLHKAVHDGNGNMLSKTVNGVSTNYTYNAAIANVRYVF